MSHALKVFIIAGEESGDILGGAILNALRHHTDRPLDIQGIGGNVMKAAGLGLSRIPMYKLAVMGLTEILPKIFFFMRAIHDTVLAIEAFKPDVVITIDCPDFCFRVQKKLHKRGIWQTRQIHVVAPTVWAWRPGRAQKIAGFLDGLVCLFPFEPPYFEEHGLPSIAMGHPAVHSGIRTMDSRPLLKALRVLDEETVVGLFCGSRQGVVNRHAPIFIDAMNKVADQFHHIRVFIPTFPYLADDLRRYLEKAHFKYNVIVDPALKSQAMRASKVALAASGTVGLELAIASVPHIVAYRLSRISWWLARLLVSTPYVHLANIVLKRPVVPEYLQDECRADKLAEEISRMLAFAGTRAQQKDQFAELVRTLGVDDPSLPADKAAEFILNIISRKSYV